MFDIETCLAFMTGNASKMVYRNFNQNLTEKGCTRVQWLALYFIGRENKLNQTDLANFMQLQTSTIVRLIDRLERDGYVYREKDITDRRISYISLTESGENIRKDLIIEVEAFSKKVTGNISEEEIKIYKNVLDKMIRNTKD